MTLIETLEKYETLRCKWSQLETTRDELERMVDRVSARLCDLAQDIWQLEDELTGLSEAAEVVGEMEIVPRARI